MRHICKTLRVNDLLFINEYLANGRNAVQAYRKVHPKASYNVAGVHSCRLLKYDRIREEIARRIQAEQGWTRAVAVSSVLDVAHRARTVGKFETELHAYVELNELAGFKVQKIEDVSSLPTMDEASFERELERRLKALATPPLEQSENAVPASDAKVTEPVLLDIQKLTNPQIQ